MFFGECWWFQKFSYFPPSKANSEASTAVLSPAVEPSGQQARPRGRRERGAADGPKPVNVFAVFGVAVAVG